MFGKDAFEPSGGKFTVSLPANLQLDAADFCSIAGVYPCTNLGGDLSYMVVFTDEQVADRYQKRADKARRVAKGQKLGSANKLTRQLTPTPGLEEYSKSTPNDRANPATAAAASFGSHAPFQVVIVGLPAKLASKMMIDAMLEQAGLEDEVTDFQLPTKRQGLLRISLDSLDAAERCATHFKGCRWNAAGSMTVKVVSAQEKGSTPSLRHERSDLPPRLVGKLGPPTVAEIPLPSSLGRSSAADVSKSSSSRPFSLPWIPPEAPAYIHSAFAKASEAGQVQKHAGSSQASTAVSDSETEEDPAIAGKVLATCRAGQPPVAGNL